MPQKTSHTLDAGLSPLSAVVCFFLLPGLTLVTAWTHTTKDMPYAQTLPKHGSPSWF